MVHVPLMFLSEWHEFPSALCLARKKKLITARVPMLLKSRVSLDMLPFELCNKKILAIRHMNRPPFPTTLSIPFYDMGKYVGLRTFQHPFVAPGETQILHSVCRVHLYVVWIRTQTATII